MNNMRVRQILQQFFIAVEGKGDRQIKNKKLLTIQIKHQGGIMDTKKKFFSTLVSMFLIGVIGFICAPYLAGEKGKSPETNLVADIMIGSSGINWLPKVSYEQLILGVSSPDGKVFQKTFESGSSPYLDISSIYGTGSCDGTYTYELRVIVASQVKSREDERKAGLQQSAKYPEPLTQTGHFTVREGTVISSGTEELARVMDINHIDDVIITGKLCVGPDCLFDGSENFGFDVIKVKDNNPRVFFDDTSTMAGFPANDWRIIANDAGSGGGNYLSIVDSTGAKTPFKIEAGAKNSAIYVSSMGRVGLGTSVPLSNLHILHGDTPSIRLDQDTSSGWTAQVFDIAGNEANFFIRDATNGYRLPFRIQPNTPTNTLTLKANGKVGIGTWSPSYPLELETTGANAVIACDRTDGAKSIISSTAKCGKFGTISNHPTRILVYKTWKLQLYSDNRLKMASGASCTAGGIWTNASSRAFKENIQSLGTDEALKTLSNLCPVKFNYKADKGEKHVGFIAEDAPELVATQDRKGMSPMDVVAVLTKVVQEQQKIVEQQQKAIAELHKKIADLEKK